MLINQLNLSTKLINCLQSHGFYSTEVLCNFPATALKEYKGIGENSVFEIKSALKEYNLSLKSEPISGKNKTSKRSRNFCIILYPGEDPAHKQIFDFYTQSKFSPCDCVWIEHDRDLKSESLVNADTVVQDDQSKFKKNHIHLMLCFKNVRTLSSIVNSLT